MKVKLQRVRHPWGRSVKSKGCNRLGLSFVVFKGLFLNATKDESSGLCPLCLCECADDEFVSETNCSLLIPKMHNVPWHRFGNAYEEGNTSSDRKNHHHQSLNREGRWGTTYDFATSFLHFSLFSTALWDLPNSRPVNSLMLSSNLFLCPPCRLPPFTVPCKMVLARPHERETWPYHCSLHLFMKVRRSSCGPIACWILAWTSSSVTWSLYEMCSILQTFTSLGPFSLLFTLGQCQHCSTLDYSVLLPAQLGTSSWSRQRLISCQVESSTVTVILPHTW